MLYYRKNCYCSVYIACDGNGDIDGDGDGVDGPKLPVWRTRARILQTNVYFMSYFHWTCTVIAFSSELSYIQSRAPNRTALNCNSTPPDRSVDRRCASTPHLRISFLHCQTFSYFCFTRLSVIMDGCLNPLLIMMAPKEYLNKRICNRRRCHHNSCNRPSSAKFQRISRCLAYLGSSP